MKLPTHTLEPRNGMKKKAQWQTPLFVYLSDVVQQYGSIRLPCSNRASGTLEDVSETQRRVAYRAFLAEKISSAQVPLFDVHSLELIVGSELEEILHDLRSSDGIKTGLEIGFEVGRDYCVDAERLNAEMKSVTSLPKFKCRPVGEHLSNHPTNISPNTPRLAFYKPEIPSGWEEQKRPVTLEFLRFRLETGRHKALAAYKPAPKTGPRSRSSPKPKLPVAATATCDWGCDVTDKIYLVGKFNRKGEPALLLEWVVTELDGDANTSTKKLTSEANAVRNAQWQEQLLAMFASGPDKGKSHKALCEVLARLLNDNKVPSDKTVIKSEQIRRVTRDPGKRKPGGKRPAP